MEDLCEMCKELGYNCQDYKPEIDKYDDEWLLSDSDEDSIPTGSDDEDNMLSKKMTSMNLRRN